MRLGLVLGYGIAFGVGSGPESWAGGGEPPPLQVIPPPPAPVSVRNLSGPQAPGVRCAGFAPRWEQFSWQTQQIATTIPYLVSDGNHEVTSEDSYGECGVPFSKRFYMPHKPAKYYYSIDYSHVHLVVCAVLQQEEVGEG